MFKLCHQFIKKIKNYYFEYKTENNKIKELKNILNYLFKLDYYYIINGKYYYAKYYNKQNTYIEIKNSNKIPNNINKLFSDRLEYLNNLPLNLKFLSFVSKLNCNLPPNIIYLSCYNCDIHNLPKSLIFLFTHIINIHNEILLNTNIIKNINRLLYDYLNTILNNYVSFYYWGNHYYHLFYILN